jgi:type II secretory pathway pseudopilin PulG
MTHTVTGKKRRQAGFSLLELTVSVLILIIIIVLLLMGRL